MLFFFPRGVLDEILNLIESVSEGFPSYFINNLYTKYEHSNLKVAEKKSASNSEVKVKKNKEERAGEGWFSIPPYKKSFTCYQNIGTLTCCGCTEIFDRNFIFCVWEERKSNKYRK